MGHFSSAWLAIADDPYGEALHHRISVRVDTDGGSDQLVELTLLESVISVPPIVRRREREVGVVQAQQWQFRFTNEDLTFNPKSSAWFSVDDHFLGKFCALEIGFPVADEWEVVAQGKIASHDVSSDLVCTISVVDPIHEEMDKTIPRDMSVDARFAWVSAIHTQGKNPASKDFDNAGFPCTRASPAPAVSQAIISDETYVIEITAIGVPHTFKVIYEDLTELTGLLTNANNDISSIYFGGLFNSFRIFAGGWATGASDYAVGDKFICYTSKIYSNDSPIGVLLGLLDTSGAESYNVLAGASQIYQHDFGHWADVQAAFAAVHVAGIFDRNTRTIELIQGMLRLVLATIYPNNLGQIGIWHLAPSEFGDTTKFVYGDPTRADASILKHTRKTEDRNIVNRVVINYKDIGSPMIDGETGYLAQVAYETIDAVSQFSDHPLIIDSVWAMTPSQVEASGNRMLLRFKDPYNVHRIKGTLVTLAGLELVDTLTIQEDFLSESLTKGLVQSVSIDTMRNEVDVLVEENNIITTGFAIVGTSTVETGEPADNVW